MKTNKTNHQITTVSPLYFNILPWWHLCKFTLCKFFVVLCDTRIKCFFQGSFISTDEKINVYLIHMGWIKLLDPKTNSGFPICRRTKLPITSFSKWHHSNRKLTMEICSNLILNIWNSIPKEAILICVNNIIIMILLETWQC